MEITRTRCGARQQYLPPKEGMIRAFGRACRQSLLASARVFDGETAKDIAERVDDGRQDFVNRRPIYRHTDEGLTPHHAKPRVPTGTIFQTF